MKKLLIVLLTISAGSIFACLPPEKSDDKNEVKIIEKVVNKLTINKELTSYADDIYQVYESINFKFKPLMIEFVNVCKDGISHLLKNPSEWSIYFVQLEEYGKQIGLKANIETEEDVNSFQKMFTSIGQFQAAMIYSNLDMTLRQSLNNSLITFDLFLKKTAKNKNQQSE